MTRWLAAFMLMVGVVTGCGAISAGGGGRSMEIESYDVVEPTDEYGPGRSVEIVGARLVEGGALQVLASGFSCGTVSGLEVDETESEVVVDVSGARFNDGECPEDVVYWYVPTPTAEPLGSRILRSRSGAKIQVADCASEPSNPRCRE